MAYSKVVARALVGAASFFLVVAPPAAPGQGTPNDSVWKLAVVRSIGSFDDPATALTEVTAGLIDEQGRVLVLQPMDRMVKVFSEDGDLMTEFGGDGSGPGEFVAPIQMGWQEEHIYVVDRATGRVSLFTPLGHHVRDWRPPIDIPADQPAMGPGPVPEALLTHDRVLVKSRRAFGAGDGGDIPEYFFVVDSLGARTGAHFEVSMKGMRFGIRNPESRHLGYFGSQPFPDSPLLTVDPRGRFMALIERSVRGLEPATRQVPVRVTKIEPQGDTAWSTVLLLKATSLPEQVRDSTFSAIWELVARARGPGMDLRSKRRALEDQLYIPSIVPPVDHAMIDHEGNIWMRVGSVGRIEQSRWVVLNRSGVFVANVLGPPGVSLLDQRDGRAIGVGKDDLGISYVLVMAVEDVS